MNSAKWVAPIATLAMLGAGSVTVLAAPASASSLWAAVAHSMSTGVTGLSWGYPIGSGPESAVAQRAVQECANHPLRPADCVWLMSAKCVALAESPEYVRAGGGFTWAEAEADALKLPPNVDLGGKPAQTVGLCSEDGDGPGGLSHP